MSYSFVENSFPVPSRLPSQPSTMQALRAVALRAHRQAVGGESAPGRWRPSAALLALLRDLLLTGDTHYPAPEVLAPPARFGVCEPDEPGLGEQLRRMEEDFVELSDTHRELVIEFMKLLRDQARASHDD